MSYPTATTAATTTRAVARVRGLASAWCDLVLPAVCTGCGTAGADVCGECRAVLLGGPPHRAGPLTHPGLPDVHAAADYAGPVRGVLIAHKEHGAHATAPVLGRALAGAVASAVGPGGAPGDDTVALVPVPSTRAAVRRRGHDATRCLARHAARELRRHGTRARVLPALGHTRRIADQAGLSAREREVNLGHALRVPGRLAPLVLGIRLVIVDDLVTTGATLTEAVRALRAAGGHVVAAAVVAAADRRRGTARDTGPTRKEASPMADFRPVLARPVPTGPALPCFRGTNVYGFWPDPSEPRAEGTIPAPSRAFVRGR